MNEARVRAPDRLVVLEHLCLLDLAPPDLVVLAHAAGFDAVGIRLIGAGPADRVFPVSAGTPMLQETMRRARDLGVRVLDVETLRLGPRTVPADYLPALEAGALLGAGYLNVTGNDADLERFTHAFALLAEHAAPFGIRPLLEPMAFKAVRSLVVASAIVAASAGGGLMVDSLHLARCGGEPSDVAALPAHLVPYVQLADAPLQQEEVDVPDDLREVLSDAAPGLVEALVARAMPGMGELPLGALLDAAPPGVPVAVEVPALALRRSMSDLDFARLARGQVRELLCRD